MSSFAKNDYPARVNVFHPGGVKTNIATAVFAEAGESSNEGSASIRRMVRYSPAPVGSAEPPE
ncbi:MAG: hypothetical protein JO106_02000 [Mycobacterium sp.]|nr:hypothetical protein [Mycobacterium sp.]